MTTNSPGLCPGRVRSRSLNFDISPFHFSELFSELLQSKPTQATIFEQFFDFELQSTQTWTRIRATIRARAEIEQEFELELLFLFEKCAREAASLGAIGHGDSGRISSRVSPFFEAISGRFFLKKMCQMEPEMASNKSQNLIKNELETKSTKHVENVLNLIPLDL